MASDPRMADRMAEGGRRAPAARSGSSDHLSIAIQFG
jgi:hypothetical protein